MKETPDFKKVQALVSQDFSSSGSIANKYRAARKEFDAQQKSSEGEPSTPVKPKRGRKPKEKPKEVDAGSDGTIDDKTSDDGTKRGKKRPRVDTDDD